MALNAHVMLELLISDVGLVWLFMNGIGTGLYRREFESIDHVLLVTLSSQRRAQSYWRRVSVSGAASQVVKRENEG